MNSLMKESAQMKIVLALVSLLTALVGLAAAFLQYEAVRMQLGG